MNSKTVSRLLWGLLAFSLFTVTGLAAWSWLAPKKEPLPVIGTVPAFTFTERSGRPAGLDDLRGHVWIADFIFTSCAGTCPVMTTHMTELQTALEQEGLEDVRLASFSVDPETDTPEVLTRFANGYGASPEKWLFFSGPAKEMQELATKGFLLAAVANGGTGEEAIIHSNRFVLVDRQGRIRKYYVGTETGIAALILQDVKMLLAEKSH